MAPWGVMNGGAMPPVQASVSCHAVCMSINGGQMFHGAYAAHLIFSPGSPTSPRLSSDSTRSKHCQCLCWHLSLSSVSLLSLSRLPVFIQAFICLLQAAYRLLYYSWAPYCSLAGAGCLFSLLYHLQPPWQSLIHNLTGLNFRITVGYCIHYSCLLQFPFILEVDYNQINTWAVGNAAGNKPELGLWQWQLPYFDFHLYFTCIIHQLTQIDLDFVAGSHPNGNWAIYQMAWWAQQDGFQDLSPLPTPLVGQWSLAPVKWATCV